MRKALIIGIDFYQNISKLSGCVNDAHSVNQVLTRNGDGSLNFDTVIETANSEESLITRTSLRESVQELFSGDPDIALFYFSGHGYVEDTGGYLITSEVTRGHDGLSFSDVLTFANNSRAKNKIIIVDSCHSGALGESSTSSSISTLSEGLTILTASTSDQYALESNGTGIFTSLLVDALNGGAANLVGDITPGSVYAHIDQSLGPWEQRPVFKTNVKSFTSLKKVQTQVTLEQLRQLTELFSSPSDEIKLDPSFEETDQTDEENLRKFRVLQTLNRVNIVVPVGEEHMYYAAMNSKSCKLTALGVHYWRLVDKNRI